MTAVWALLVVLVFCVCAVSLAFARGHWRWWGVWVVATLACGVALYTALGPVPA